MTIKRVHGTQFADALRRSVEQLYNLGDINTAEEVTLKGVDVVNRTAGNCGWDWKLAEVGVDLMLEVVKRADSSTLSVSKLTEIASVWYSDDEFRNACRSHNKAEYLIEHNRDILLGTSSSSTDGSSAEHTPLYTGIVKTFVRDFGFIETESLGDVHMNRSSLIQPNTWQDLRIGQRVVFALRYGGPHPHALRLQPNAEPEQEAGANPSVPTERMNYSEPDVE